MKTHQRVILSAIVGSVLLLAGSAAALETTAPVETQTDDKAGLQQRLEKRKTEFNIKQVTNVEKLRIQQKCKASQGNLSSLKGRITGIDTSRENVYRALNERLTKLAERLKTAGADTTELQTEIDALNTKIEVFKADLVTYKSAVSDLAVMDCAADPVAFKASLEAARAARTKVAADASDIKKYVNDTIKPTLKQIRTQLAGDKKEGDQ